MPPLAPVALLAGLLAAAPGPLPAPIRLQALVATSGNDPAVLLDGDAQTAWRPEGDPVDEGVLFRFEKPTRFDEVEVVSCFGRYALDLFANGRALAAPVAFTQGDAATPPQTAAELARFSEAGRVTLGRDAQAIQSLFVKVASADGEPCLGEVRFFRGGLQIPVRAPRRVPGSVAASSTLAPAAAYHPGYLFDDRLDFGWVEGAKGAGEGEAVTVTLDAPLELGALEVWNGYQRSPDHFQKNARARKVSVTLDGGPPIALELKDAMGAQRLTLPAPTQARRIRIAIESVYPGKLYADLVISELRLWDADGPVGVAVSDGQAMRKALAEAVKGGPVGTLIGRRLWNGCNPGDGIPHRTLKLRGDHTFVIYESSQSGFNGASSEVFDGTWVPTAAGSKAEAVVELFGRRHRVDETWNPYEDDAPKRKETDRISGGRLKIAVLGPGGAAIDAAIAAGGSCLDGGVLTTQGAVIVRGPPLTGAFRLHAP
jgi:hypothetical protein